MRYNLILKKDLPNFPAGTVFKNYGIKPKMQPSWDGKFEKKWYNEIGYPDEDGEYDVFEREVGDFFDDEKWFDKKLDYDYLFDLKCPRCGETKGAFFSTKYYCRDMDRYDYGVQYGVGFECLCGHKRVLYGTEYGIKSLKEKIEFEDYSQ